MDQFDSKILMQLQEDAKQNTKQIAAKIGLSITPTYERIKKLNRDLGQSSGRYAREGRRDGSIGRANDGARTQSG